jgi:hypothetical protein
MPIVVETVQLRGSSKFVFEIKSRRFLQAEETVFDDALKKSIARSTRYRGAERWSRSEGEYLALRTAPIRRDLSQLQEPIGEAIGLALDRGIERLDRMPIGFLEAAGSAPRRYGKFRRSRLLRSRQPAKLAGLQKVTGGPDLDRAFEDVDKGIIGRCKRVPKRTTVFDPHLEHRNRKTVECGRDHTP